jgi:hypothetical protein
VFEREAAEKEANEIKSKIDAILKTEKEIYQVNILKISHSHIDISIVNKKTKTKTNLEEDAADLTRTIRELSAEIKKSFKGVSFKVDRKRFNELNTKLDECLVTLIQNTIDEFLKIVQPDFSATISMQVGSDITGIFFKGTVSIWSLDSGWEIFV